MRIAIDVSPIIYNTGVSHYRFNLVKSLLKNDHKNDYVLYGGSLRRINELKNKIKQLGEGFDTKTLPLPPILTDLIWNKLHILPVEKVVGKIDLFHTSDWVEPPSLCAKVTTIHDLIPFKYPKITPQIVVNTHKNKLKWVKKESKVIIVPSIATKNDLVDFGFDREKVVVIYEAPNLIKSLEDGVNDIKNKFILDNYFISIGTHQRKNLRNTIRAFKLLKTKYKKFKLVVVGESKFITKDLLNNKDVVFAGNIDDQSLSSLLTGAKALIFPSLYEGLGVPILDSFNCDTPVITSNISSMPEVAGEAAILVDPNNVISIAEGVVEALNNSEKYIQRGRSRIKEFSWDKTASETLKVYEKAIIQ